MAFEGGAAAVVSQVMTVVQQLANERNSSLKSEIANAVSACLVPPRTEAYQKLQVQDVLRSQELQVQDNRLFKLAELETTYDEKTAKVAEGLIDSFNAFLTANFPSLDDYVTAAEAWVTRALTTGGSGINALVEDQLWARERARTLREAKRASEEATTSWLAKGFALPPGALIHQAAVIDREAQEKIGEASRERAIKSFEAELENLRLAVARSLDLRTAATTAATEYMRAVALAPALGLQLTQNVQAAHQRLNDVLLEFYKADQFSHEFNLKHRVTDSEAVRHKEDVDLGAKVATLQKRVDATMAGAQAQGQQAAAALNGLHGSAAVSGSDQTVVSYDGGDWGG